MRRTALIIVPALIFCLALVACGGGGAGETDGGDIGPGDAARGEEIYNKTVIGSASAPGCITCHSLDAGVTLVGPAHAGIAPVSETRGSGKSAEQYLKDAITDPDADVTEDFAPGVMYQNYAKELSGQQIADLVAFLMTLR